MVHPVCGTIFRGLASALSQGHYDELPERFLAYDDDFTKTFEWIFAHHSDLQKEVLATRKAELEIHGEERIYLVRKLPALKRE